MLFETSIDVSMDGLQEVWETEIMFTTFFFGLCWLTEPGQQKRCCPLHPFQVCPRAVQGCFPLMVRRRGGSTVGRGTRTLHLFQDCVLAVRMWPYIQITV